MIAARPDVVTPLHVRLLELVGRVADEYGAPDLRLEGGTALAAYYLGHRESEDLDFFGDPGLNALHFREAVIPVAEAEGFAMERLRSASRGFARVVARDAGTGVSVRLDFAASSPFHLAPRELTTEGVRVASYRDLCAGKLHAICDRFEPRDFVDLHVILMGGAHVDLGSNLRTRFRTVLHDLFETDPGLDPILVGGGLMQGHDRPILSAFPLRVLVPIQEADIQRTIRACAEMCAEMSARDVPETLRLPPDPM